MMKRNKPVISAGWILFLAAAAILLLIIGVGAMTDRGPTRPWLELADERALSPTSIPIVDVSLRVTQLREAPVLDIHVTGLDPGRPLELWLSDPRQEFEPYQLTTELEVDDEGRVEERIEIPTDAWHRYTYLIGRQDERDVFRAIL